MLILIRRIDKTWGGYDYIEIDTHDKVYSQGNSSGHRGHGYSSKTNDGTWLNVNVTTLKELKNIISDLENQNFTKINSMYEYHASK